MFYNNKHKYVFSRVMFFCVLFLLNSFAATKTIAVCADDSVTTRNLRDVSREILLWPDGAPGALSNSDADKPVLFAYPAKKSDNNGMAVIICPGGAYRKLSMGHEGHDVAKWLNIQGVSAFVLRSRFSPYRHPVPINDAKRAMRTVRHLAGKHALDTTRIGILGFSAGGHLASTLMTHYDKGDLHSSDSIEQKKSRPDFGILVYPVITLVGKYAHTYTRDNLLGPSSSPELQHSLSNQFQVTQNTPPAFLAHGDRDGIVSKDNSCLFDSALTAHGVQSQLFIDKGKGHAYGLNGHWPDACVKWMNNMETILVSSILRKERPSKSRPSVQPVVQTGVSYHLDLPFCNSVYYILHFNNPVTRISQRTIFLSNGKQILHGDSKTVNTSSPF